VTLPGPLVGVDWLADHVDDPEVVVADVRWYLDGRSGRAAYDAGHVPGAVFVDVDGDLAVPQPAGTPGGRHPLPTAADFAAAMSRLGIGDASSVVAYDDASGAVAARLWWMLTVTGHDAGVLDGGLAAWPGSLSTEPAALTPAEFSPRPWPPEHMADAASVAKAPLVLDARAAERYRGEAEPVDPRAGHIPGAVSAPFAGNLDPSGRFLSPGDLRQRYEALGADTNETIVSCGSGINACHLALAFAFVGLPPPSLYVGSYSDWVSDPSRPVAR